MNFHAGIIPFIEARIYLTKRFCKERMAQLIETNRYKRACLLNYDFTYIEKIGELERELDERFPADELMTRYFKPLKLREERGGDPISIGAMLLIHSEMLTEHTDIDALIEAFRANTREQNITHFYRTTLFPFGINAASEYTLPDFMQATNEMLADPEEKWALVDAASNPVEHLMKLKPLVSAVAAFIAERKTQFEPLLAHIGEFFSEGGEGEEMFILQLHVGKKELDGMHVFPCLFMFGEATVAVYEDLPDSDAAPAVYEVLFGSFADVIIRYRKYNRDPEAHLALLRVLSDNTRFKVLHELCDKSSYGLELSESYGITRNAMYYQLEKLSEHGLVEAKYEDRRMLHTMDKRAVFEKLTALRDYLVNGWKPEEYKE